MGRISAMANVAIVKCGEKLTKEAADRAAPIAAQLFEACTGSNPDPWSVMQRMFDVVMVEVESRTGDDLDALDFILDWLVDRYGRDAPLKELRKWRRLSILRYALGANS
jgi:hypothetical protein